MDLSKWLATIASLMTAISAAVGAVSNGASAADTAHHKHKIAEAAAAVQDATPVNPASE